MSKTDVEAGADAAVESALMASRALVGVAARSLAAVESEITLRQYRALVVLAEYGEQNVGALADALDIHASTATRLCDRLLAKGLIERSTSPENRREVTVMLSPDGQALVRAVSNRRRRELRRVIAQLDTRARRSLIQAFETFAAVAGELHDDAWRLGWT
jgi:DNA-binding MarR family transcriptional regulator